MLKFTSVIDIFNKKKSMYDFDFCFADLMHLAANRYLRLVHDEVEIFICYFPSTHRLYASLLKSKMKTEIKDAIDEML